MSNPTATPTKIKIVGFEVTEDEWKALKQKCLDTGHNFKTLFRPYVDLLLKKKAPDVGKV